MSKETQKVIFSFFGPPGSGKGTLAKQLVEKAKFHFLSTGNLCRKHVSNGTELGKKLDQYLKRGALIPDNLVVDMVIDWLQPKMKHEDFILLDGFPRTKGQASHFLDYLKTTVASGCFRVILITLPDDEIVKRLSSRRVCGNSDCQAVYSAAFKKDHCQYCGNSLIKRSDDQEDVIRDRLKFYPAYRDSLLNFYKSVGLNVEILDVSGMSPEQVFKTFLATL